eukprot:1085411-Prymnesium_polylepis.1
MAVERLPCRARRVYPSLCRAHRADARLGTARHPRRHRSDGIFCDSTPCVVSLKNFCHDDPA